jgi:hypothetical protein
MRGRRRLIGPFFVFVVRWVNLGVLGRVHRPGLGGDGGFSSW